MLQPSKYLWLETACMQYLPSTCALLRKADTELSNSLELDDINQVGVLHIINRTK
jgi:hypothetical protein